MNAMNVAVVVAAGKSRRMGGGRNKVLNLLGGRPVLSYCLEVFQQSPQVQQVVIVGREDDREEMEAVARDYCPKAAGHFITGGAERFDSVKNGLEYWEDWKPDSVLIHDGARPFLQEEFIRASLNALSEVPGCVVGVPLRDTLKEVSGGDLVTQTHDRSCFWLAQTPQVFRYEVILNAYRSCHPPPYPTDDGAVLEMLNQPVRMVQGSYQNMNLTTPEDWQLAEAIITARNARTL